jgi:hypothetical protein
VITGRGPGAPSVTPDVVCTLGQPARGQAVDLTEIRHTDALMDLLASRRLPRPRDLGDPAVTLLSSLTRDVDTPAVSTAPGGTHRRPPVSWGQAAAAVVIFLAAVVAAAGFLVAGMLTRLAGAGTRGRR